MERKYIAFDTGKPAAILSATLLMLLVAVFWAALSDIPKLYVGIGIFLILGPVIWLCFRIDSKREAA